MKTMCCPRQPQPNGADPMSLSKITKLIIITPASSALAIILAVAGVHPANADAMERFKPQPCADESCRLSRQAQDDAARARAESNRATMRDDSHDNRLKVGRNTSIGVG